MPILPYLGVLPVLGDDPAVDADAFVIGNVTVGSGARIGPRAVLRADQAEIRIGRRFCIGEASTVHVDPGFPTTVGDEVVVEERAVVHGCTLGDAVLVEREATILTGSVVGEGSIVRADALIAEGKQFPARSVIAGTPGRVIRQTTDEEVADIRRRAAGGS